MSGRFEGRAAVVTGGGQGIGREIARQLALEGAGVLVNDRDEGLAEDAARAIVAEGGAARAAGGDVADVEVTRDLVKRAVAAFGRLDVAVANAGITMHCDFLDYRPEDFDRLLAVNLRGSFFLAQAAVLRFREQGTPGRVLFLSSVTGHLAIRQMAAYGMTKAALEALARNLSLEVAPLGTTVNAIAPGATVTPRTVSDALPAVGRGRARHRPEPGRGRRLDRDGRGARQSGALSLFRVAPRPFGLPYTSGQPEGPPEPRRKPSPRALPKAGLPQGPAERTRFRAFARRPRSYRAKALTRETTASSATSFSAPSGMMRSA